MKINLINFINNTFGSLHEFSILIRNKIKQSDSDFTLDTFTNNILDTEIDELCFSFLKIKRSDILLINFLECTEIECNYIAYIITGETLDLFDNTIAGWTFDHRLSFIIAYEYELRKLCGDSVYKSLI